MKTTAEKNRRTVWLMLMTFVMLLLFSSTSFTKNATSTQLPGNRLILMCHFGRMIRVDQDAVKYHLSHGDKIGVCDPATPFE